MGDVNVIQEATAAITELLDDPAPMIAYGAGDEPESERGPVGPQ
jgi:hypothetical protein